MNTLASRKEAPRDLSRRSTESEWLDGADVSPEELALVLRDLARFNGAMLGHWPVINWLRAVTKDPPKDRTLSLVDVGCGDTFVVESLARRHPRATFYAVDSAFTAELIEVFSTRLTVPNVWRRPERESASAGRSQ